MSALRVNVTKITAGNVFNGDQLCIEGKQTWIKKRRNNLLLGIFADS